jgi:hypothetical protein
VLYDVKSSEHFHLFPKEVCVVYSHDNYFTSVTSDREDLIQAIFEDILERYLAPLCNPPLSPELVSELYRHTKTYGCIRIQAERLYQDPQTGSFLLVTYPKKSTRTQKLVSRMPLADDGTPTAVSEAEYLPRWRYYLYYSDFTMMPVVLVVSLMTLAVLFGLYFRILFPSQPL